MNNNFLSPADSWPGLNSTMTQLWLAESCLTWIGALWLKRLDVLTQMPNIQNQWYKTMKFHFGEVRPPSSQWNTDSVWPFLLVTVIRPLSGSHQKGLERSFSIMFQYKEQNCVIYWWGKSLLDKALTPRMKPTGGARAGCMMRNDPLCLVFRMCGEEGRSRDSEWAAGRVIRR